MPVILNKKIISKLYESDKSLIYRAFDNIDKKDVILKILKADCPDLYESNRYKNEYEMIRSFDNKSTIKAHSFEKYNGSYVLILEDIQAVSLNKFCENKSLGIKEFLDIAINIVESLGEIHSKNIIHKNLNPSNIIYNPLSGQIKIIDFGISSVLSLDTKTIKKNQNIESNVAYISPEQTGKMDCSIDFRSDFYSLGITFYELLIGTLPFTNSDPMEMVYAHFAKQPLEPNKLNSKIPRPVSDIVMKLIEKNPDNRYQNTLSIINDLTQCRHLLKTKGNNFNFSVHTPPFSKELKICDRVFGRNQELDRLSSLFKKVCEGHKKIAIISGNAGVGKTALVMEFCKKNVLNKSYFISGKFDQVQQDIPYGAIVDAFSQLIQQILMEKVPAFQQYKENFQSCLGSNGQLMIDLFPELEYIIGPQAPVVELPITESQNRFKYVFQNFISSLASLPKPIIFFLDDLQWADIASLDLLQMIFFSDEIKYGFFIGAFRDNEVVASHPWWSTLHYLQNKEVKTGNLYLHPLNLQDVNQCISASLNCSMEKCFELSKLVKRKTLGNPFFIRKFLRSAQYRRLLELNIPTNIWQWQLAKMEEMDLSGNIVGLIMETFHHLGHDALNVLKTASCLGNCFQLDTLSKICNMPTNQVLQLLNDVIKQDVLIRVKDGYTFNKVNHSNRLKKNRKYKFLHDRFQNAAYSLIKKKDRAKLHWKIGNLLLDNVPNINDAEEILKIVNHLNLGKTSITRGFEKNKLAKINLLAAKKAKSASAYQAAFSYLEASISLFCSNEQNRAEGTSLWDKDYDLCLFLHEEAVETAFLISNYDRMEQLAGIIDKNARKITDRVKTNCVRIRAFYAQNRMFEAIELGIEFAKKIGLILPKRPTKARIIYELLKIKIFLRGKDIEKLADQPEMTNSEKRAVFRILSSLTLPAFYAMPNLIPLIVFKGIRLSVTYGNTEHSLFGYAGYGLIMCGFAGDISTGYKFGELAKKLLDKLDSQKVRCRTMATIYSFIWHWKMPLKEALPHLQEAYKFGLEFGDHQYAAVSAKAYCSRAIYVGIDLEKLEQEINIYTKQVQRINQDAVLNSILILKQFISNFTGNPQKPWHLKGDAFNYEKMYPLLETSNDQMALFTANLMSLMLCYLFNKHQKAVEFSSRVKKYKNIAKSMPDIIIFNFFESLSLLAVLQRPVKNKRMTYLGRVKANQKQMKKWSRFAPMNIEHLLFLVEAERYNLVRDIENAKKFYDLAIQFSNKNGYVNYEAIANELAGKFYMKQQDLNKAKDYILSAHQCYLRWGALKKSSDLELKYPVFFQKSIFSSKVKGFKGVDIFAVLKASQAISKTMEFDKLMAKLLQVIIKNSGAQKACLLLYSDKILKIEAMATTNPDKIEIFNSHVADEDNRELPISILYYSVRSGQSIILGNAGNKNKFSSDPYLIKNKPFSILCTPLSIKKLVKGVLYLEHNLLKNAFSESHLNVLNIFTSQILISIENSQLFETLVKEIEKKDRAVKEIKIKQELLQNISAELAVAEERERKTIAEDLHDSVSQSLAFSIARLKSLDLTDIDHTRDQLMEILDYLNQAANNISSLTFQLSPPLLRDLGFEDTLEWLCDDVFTRYGLKIIFKNRIRKSVSLDETVKLTLYRVIKELAMNIVKHANVKTAALTIFSENNYFFTVLKDNGVGFDVQMSLEKSQRFGLFSVYQRMKAINGDIEIISEKGKGTKVIIKVAYCF